MGKWKTVYWSNSHELTVVHKKKREEEKDDSTD